MTNCTNDKWQPTFPITEKRLGLGKATIGHILVITHVEQKSPKYKNTLDVAFIDYEKAFDSVDTTT